MRIATVFACLIAGVVTLGAQSTRFTPELVYAVLSDEPEPAMRLASGDTITTPLPDGKGTGYVGPFFVEDAEPGDLLVVTIEALTPTGVIGYSTAVVGAGAVAPGELGNRDVGRIPWIIDTAAGIARLDMPAVMPNVDWRERFDPPAIDLPLRPSLASIGVAPAGGGPVGGSTVGAFGGLLDVAGLEAGATVMLPVFEPGAHLYLGHGYARQGDGMATGTGIEVPMDIALGVAVVKKGSWPHSSIVRPSTVVAEFEMAWPRIETAEYLMTVGGAPTLDEALRRATLELHHWLDDDFGLNEVGVSLFMGQAVEYEVGRVAGDTATVVAKVKKAYLPVPTPEALAN